MAATVLFVPNGLLGSGHFQPNGLLGGSTSSPSSSPPRDIDQPEDEMQDLDELPPVSEAFSLPPITEPLPPPLSPPRKTHIKATTFDGKTFFIKKRLILPKPKTTFTNTRVDNLLDVPIHRLLDQLSAETAKKLHDQSIPSYHNAPTTPQNEIGTLWVDRYRPQRFTELMGNERAAREAIAWVKQWDWCVFGKSKGKRRFNPSSSSNETGAKDEVEDEYHRPKQKILLISGPPGLGKTTLAHVVASHAGYSVMEINASDARSAQIVDDRIRPALESGSMVGSSKPVLLVIDEIDGATGGNDNSSGFIHRLIQLTLEKPRKKGRSTQRDPNAKRPILRPIICICNDINASSLTKLRPIAHQIRYQRPADVHTVKRLREICEIEGLKAESRALSTLVGVAKGDLRGCLNTLQFIQSRNDEVTEAVVRRATQGMREADSTITSVLNNLFIPLAKKRVKELGLSTEEENRYVARLNREIDTCGKESSIAVGCFAHYTTLHRHDANFSRYEKANEWLATFDHFSTAMYSEGDFALAQYLPYALIPFHPLFRERGGSRVERNQADWENSQVTKSNEEIYKSLGRGLQTASTRYGGDYRHFVCAPILQLEFAPLINRIISPPLRPVNSQIIKPGEKALLSRLVSIMASLELRFVQERADDGQLAYRLDPPVDVFVTYDGKRAADISVSRYAVRHIVACEVDAAILSRNTDIIEKGKRGKHQFFGKQHGGSEGEKPSPSKRAADSEPLDSVHPSKRAKTEHVDIADRPPTDFFGRPITVSSEPTSRSRKDELQKKFKVSYKFHEGNSAAVRKPVKISAFL